MPINLSSVSVNVPTCVRAKIFLNKLLVPRYRF